MPDEKSKLRKRKKHKAPKGRTTDHQFKSGDEELEYKATAEWIVLTRNEKPKAEMFHISYVKKEEPSSSRPVSFTPYTLGMIR